MRIARLADLLELKYKTAAKSEADQLLDKINHQEKIIRYAPDILYHFVKRYNIIRVCGEAGAAKGETEAEKKAMKGQSFCKKITSIVDALAIGKGDLPIITIQEGLQLLASEISKEYDKDNFADEVELIFQMMPSKTQHDRKLRDEQYNKLRTGMSELLKSSKKGLAEIQTYYQLWEEAPKMGLTVPPELHEEVLEGETELALPSDFKPSKASLSVGEIINFIRQHGNEYGINSKEDWEKIITDDIGMKNLLTTVINAINRGHVPKDKEYVKQQIQDILKTYKEKQVNNSALFEEEEP